MAGLNLKTKQKFITFGPLVSFALLNGVILHAADNPFLLVCSILTFLFIFGLAVIVHIAFDRSMNENVGELSKNLENISYSVQHLNDELLTLSRLEAHLEEMKNNLLKTVVFHQVLQDEKDGYEELSRELRKMLLLIKSEIQKGGPAVKSHIDLAREIGKICSAANERAEKLDKTGFLKSKIMNEVADKLQESFLLLNHSEKSLLLIDYISKHTVKINDHLCELGSLEKSKKEPENETPFKQGSLRRAIKLQKAA